MNSLDQGLFANTEIRPRRSRRLRQRKTTIKIPTGVPRLIESSTERRARERSESWSALAEVVTRSVRARLELLAGRKRTDTITCPWSRLYVGACAASCRCAGTGSVEVGFLIDHYDQIVKEFRS